MCALSLSIDFLCALSLCLYTFCVRSLTREREHAKSVKTQRERTYFLNNVLRGSYDIFIYNVWFLNFQVI